MTVSGQTSLNSHQLSVSFGPGLTHMSQCGLMGRHGGLMGLWIEQSEFGPWLESLCCALGQNTLSILSQYLFSSRCGHLARLALAISKWLCSFFYC